MIFYFGLLIFMVLLARLVSTKTIKGTNGVTAFGVITYGILLFLYTFRSLSVGWDTETYVQIFMSAPSRNVSTDYLEKGWVILNKVIYAISPTKTMFFFVVGAIALTCFFKVTKRYSKNICLSIIIYYMMCFYFSLMNQQRCDMAICICMVAFVFLYERKYFWSVLITLFASTMHKSALVFLLFIIFDLCIKKYSKKIFTFFGLAVAFVFIFFNRIFLFLTRYYYTSYLTESRFLDEIKPGNLNLFLCFLLLFIAVLFLDINRIKQLTDTIVTDNYPEDLRLTKLLYTSVLFALAFQLFSLKNGMIARFANYFSIYFPIVIANAIENNNGKNKRIVSTCVFSLLIIFMIISLKFSENGMGKDNVIPYIFNPRG